MQVPGNFLLNNVFMMQEITGISKARTGPEEPRRILMTRVVETNLKVVVNRAGVSLWDGVSLQKWGLQG